MDAISGLFLDHFSSLVQIITIIILITTNLFLSTMYKRSEGCLKLARLLVDQTDGQASQKKQKPII